MKSKPVENREGSLIILFEEEVHLSLTDARLSRRADYLRDGVGRHIGADDTLAQTISLPLSANIA